MAHILVFVEELYRVIDKVVKIHCAGRNRAAGIFVVNLRNSDLAPVSGCLCARIHFLRRAEFVLCPAYLVTDNARVKFLFVKVKVADYMLYEALAVGRVVYRKARLKADAVCVAAQHFHAGRVKSRCPNIGSCLTEHIGKPRFKLLGSLVGECDGKYAPRRNRLKRRQLARLVAAAEEYVNITLARIGRYLITVAGLAVAQEVCNSVYEHRGFAASGACKDEQCALSRHNSLSLHGIELCKIVLDYLFSRFNVFFSEFHIHNELFYHEPCQLSRQTWAYFFAGRMIMSAVKISTALTARLMG